MLCQKNRCRGTLFEYELMHNFHYFLCVLSLPLTLLPPPHPRTYARRTRQGGRGSAHRSSSHSTSFLSLLVCSAVAKGGTGDGFEVRSARSVWGAFAIHIKSFTELAASPASPAQPSTAQHSPAQHCSSYECDPRAIKFNPSKLLMVLFHLLACLQQGET
jgi:hypothetical protein